MLVALSRYHRLTRSFPQYCSLLEESCQQLLVNCENTKAVRSVYDLIINGVLSRPAMRSALSSKGLGLRDLLETIIVPHKSPRKRRRADKPLVTEAAQAGIHSRVVRLILTGWTGDWSSISARLETIAEEPVQGWAGDVLLAAQLRVWNTLNWAQAAWPLQIDTKPLSNDDTLLETRLEMVSVC